MHAFPGWLIGLIACVVPIVIVNIPDCVGPQLPTRSIVVWYVQSFGLVALYAIAVLV